MKKDEFTKQVTSKLDQLAREQHHNKMLVRIMFSILFKRDLRLFTVSGK